MYTRQPGANVELRCVLNYSLQQNEMATCECYYGVSECRERDADEGGEEKSGFGHSTG